jgi:adenine-specific DNA-methyltransferase
MSIEEQIKQLIEKYRYETNKTQSEADVRANYIDWLFSHLGWDVWGGDPQHATTYHREGYIRGAGYVDVGLEVARQPVLMLEAKRFGVLVSSAERKYDRTPEEKQLFKYARSKKIPYCILTNFERLHVFNADHERLILASDNPAEYLDRLYKLQRLSPERVKTGSLQASERHLEIKDVDEAFLASLQSWRLQLANSIYQHNLTKPVLQTDGSLDFDKLMAAVQRVLDRLILIRYADDKEVLLTYDVIDSILSNYQKKGGYARPDDLMRDFIDLSHRMDERHNTTLFQPGHICEQVFISDDVLEHIMGEMNNISFRKFTSDILGNTYETYLGTKLVLRDGEIESEARRDIRKAGGIFYTPPMIVRYIVDNTLGCLLNELEKQYGVHAIEKAKEIKVLDPACGSGSFLTYAYQALANFYRRMNQQIEDEQVKLLVDAASPDMFKRLGLLKHLPLPFLDYPHHILQKQLYGVDIDPEAAEIAAVNLTMQAFTDARQEKLPLILNENIKVGNSLISGSEQELRRYFSDNWKDKRPFNWEEGFPQIMNDGGFDIVIGNPPWGANLVEYTSYLEEKFHLAKGQYDSYELFLELSKTVLRKGGVWGFLIPDSIFKPEHMRLREFLCQNQQIEEILKLGEGFFKGVYRACVILIFKNQLPQEGHEVSCTTLMKEDRKTLEVQTKIDLSVLKQAKALGTSQDSFRNSPDYAFNIVSDDADRRIMHRMEANTLDWQRLFDSWRGVEFSEGGIVIQCPNCSKWDNPPRKRKGVYRIKVCRYCNHQYYFDNSIRQEVIVSETPQRDTDKPFVSGDSVNRYYISKIKFIDITKDGINYKDPGIYQGPKILIRKTGVGIYSTIESSGVYVPQAVFIFKLKQNLPEELQQYKLQYFLGILNSRLMLYYYYKKFGELEWKSFPYITQNTIQQLPIMAIDFHDPKSKELHEKISEKVTCILQQNIGAVRQLDEEIENLVTQLYSINADEKAHILNELGKVQKLRIIRETVSTD